MRMVVVAPIARVGMRWGRRVGSVLRGKIGSMGALRDWCAVRRVISMVASWVMGRNMSRRIMEGVVTSGPIVIRATSLVC